VISLVLSAAGSWAASDAFYGDLSDTVRDLSGSLPVFPGAEGFGTATPAGRGGRVVRVVNLNREGEGSLRAALGSSGPREVVFEVGGIIDLNRDLYIREPFVTVAGQTAPSPGITLIGAGIRVKTHDVLLQHLRIRVGDREDGMPPDDRDALDVEGEPDPKGEAQVFANYILKHDTDSDGKLTYEEIARYEKRLTREYFAQVDLNNDGAITAEDAPPASGAAMIEVYNVVVDHCSMAWGMDETVSTWNPGVHDITFSNCIIAESLLNSMHSEGPHSKAFLFGDYTKRVASIRNLLAHNDDRGPLVKGDVCALIVNELIYNPGRVAIGFSAPEFKGAVLADVIGNVMIPGPSTKKGIAYIYVQDDVDPKSRIYAAGNNLGSNPLDLQPAQKAGEPIVQVKPLTILPAHEVEAFVLEHAGARPAHRDSVDKRIVDSVRTRTGRIIDSPSQVGGFPTAEPTHKALDIPADPEKDSNGDGYTNLEEWLHGLAAKAEGR